MDLDLLLAVHVGMVGTLRVRVLADDLVLALLYPINLHKLRGCRHLNNYQSTIIGK